MLDPSDLIAVARLLLTAGTAPPTEAQLRRAVSTAYYALFHTVSRAAAERFMGPGSEDSAGYVLLYRGFNHGRMRTICKELDARQLSKELRRHLGKDVVSQDARSFAIDFAALQEARHSADYDPRALFLPSDTSELIEMAVHGLAAFSRIAPDEQADILALMLVSARS